MPWFTDKAGQIWIWVKEKGKWMILATATAILGVAGVNEILKEEPLTLEEVIIQKIEVMQDAHFKEYGHYKNEYRNQDWKAVLDISEMPDFEITIRNIRRPPEHWKGKGEGCQVIFKKDDRIKSFGYGIDADIHTFEIMPAINATSTP